MKNEKCTLQDMEYREKTKITVNENNTRMVGSGLWRDIVTNVKTEKYTLQDLDYVEKTENRGK